MKAPFKKAPFMWSFVVERVLFCCMTSHKKRIEGIPMDENKNQQQRSSRCVPPQQDLFAGETHRLRRVTSQYKGPHAQSGAHGDVTHVIPQRSQMRSRQVRPAVPVDAQGNPQPVSIPQVSQVGQSAPHAATTKAASGVKKPETGAKRPARPTVAMSIEDLEAVDGTQVMTPEKKTQASRNASKAMYPQETEVMSRGPLPAGARAQSAMPVDKTEHFTPVVHGNYRSSGKPAPECVSYSGGVSIPKKKPKSKGRKFLKGLLAIMLFLLLTVCGVAGYWAHSVSSAMSVDSEHRADLMGALQSSRSNGAFYMLLLGSDARPGEVVGRADVNILARIDVKNGQVTLVSIPRDTMIEIPEYGIQKINAAHATGGPAGAVQAVSDFAGVPITHYAEINFEGTIELIDRLGGIEVNVPQDTYTWNGYFLPAGPQTLDGSQALAFARERKSVAGGDFGRAQAQRLVIKAILEKILSLPPTQIPGVVQQLADCVSTDMSVTKVVELALRMQTAGMTTYSAAVPSYAFNQDGVSYVGTMYAEWKAMMQRVDAGLDPHDVTATIPEKQLNNPKLGSAPNARSPEDYSMYMGGMTTNDVAPLYGE